eukprot:5629220-Amphidinium_carterae.1
MAKRLQEFLERSGRNQSAEAKDEYDRRFEEEMEGVEFAAAEEEGEPAEDAEGEGEGDQAEEPKAKMPTTESQGISLAPGI